MSFYTELTHMTVPKIKTELPTSSLDSHFSSPTKTSSLSIKPLDLGLSSREFSSIPKPVDFHAASPHPFSAPTKAVVPTFEPAKLTLMPRATTDLVKTASMPSVKLPPIELTTKSIPIPALKPHVEVAALTPPVKFHDNPLSPVPDMHLGSVISHVNPNDFLPRVELPRTGLPHIETPHIDLPRSVVDLGHLLPTRPGDNFPVVKPTHIGETPRIDLLNPGSKVDLADLFPTRPRVDELPDVHVKAPRIDEPSIPTAPRVRPDDFSNNIAAREAALEAAARARQMALHDALLASTSMPSLTSTPTSRAASSNPAQLTSDVPEGQGTAFSAQTYAEDLKLREAFNAKQDKEIALTSRNIQHSVMNQVTETYRAENEYLTSRAEQEHWNKQRWDYKPTYDQPVLHLPLASNFKAAAPVAEYA